MSALGCKMILAAVLYLALLVIKSSAQEIVTPITINIKVVSGAENGQCPAAEETERALNETDQQVRSLLSEYVASCGGPGWRQVAFIDMTDTSNNCPPGLKLTSHSKRTCGRSVSGAGCFSTTFSVGGTEYSQVCGRIRGYQFGVTQGFWGSLSQHGQGIDGYYLDGVSLTHGPNRRQHIWSFTAGNSEVDNENPLRRCPCDTSDRRVVSPPFVGSDYFCESGNNGRYETRLEGMFFPNDPLWDGQNCRSTSTCCQFNNPPWFTKILPNPTTDNIEMRICHENTQDRSTVVLELIELYVQ